MKTNLKNKSNFFILSKYLKVYVKLKKMNICDRIFEKRNSLHLRIYIFILSSIHFIIYKKSKQILIKVKHLCFKHNVSQWVNANLMSSLGNGYFAYINTRNIQLRLIYLSKYYYIE